MKLTFQLLELSQFCSCFSQQANGIESPSFPTGIISIHGQQSPVPVATIKQQSPFDFTASVQAKPRASGKQKSQRFPEIFQGFFSFSWLFFEIPSKSRSWNTEGQRAQNSTQLSPGFCCASPPLELTGKTFTVKLYKGYK